MPLPDQFYLRQTDGSPVGPFVLTALEVLYDARVVDERTPISVDGQAYLALSEWPEVVQRLLSVKDALGRGEDPWPDQLPVASEMLPTEDIEGTNLIRMLVSKAGAHATGTLLMVAEAGEIQVDLKDGKVVDIRTEVPALVLSEYLLDRRLIDEDALARVEVNAPTVGADLGATLVAQGVLAPHAYFEAHVGWARWVLGQLATGAYGLAAFQPGDVQTPSIPFGFDRLSLPIEVVRNGIDMRNIRDHLMAAKRCPVIPSQVEGVSLEDCKLQPREFRVLNKANGVRTVQDLLQELGGSDEKDRPVLRAIYFAEQAGFIVLGEDQAGQRERAEASKLESKFRRKSLENDFEVLGIDEKSTDEEVRAKFTDLAKLYHPDTHPPDADPALIEARQKMFALVSGAFERLETEKQRYQYAHELDVGAGAPQPKDALELQNTLQAETAFKKGEILSRVRKYEEALEHIDEAIRLNPRDTEFKIQREYIGYLQAAKTGNPETLAHETIRRVLHLLKDDANIASGYLVLGHLNKAVGKNEVATRYFEKVLEYDEDQPVALQEVRLANLRKDRELKRKKRWL